MKIIQLHHLERILVDDRDYERVQSLSWQYHKTRGIEYARHKNAGDKTILLHRFILNAKDGDEVDHINGNGLDNRRENLRIVTHSQNMMNRAMSRNNTSGVKGVSWNERDKRWMAKIVADKSSHTKYCVTKEEAITVYNQMKDTYFGVYARN